MTMIMKVKADVAFSARNVDEGGGGGAGGGGGSGNGGGGGLLF